MNASSQHNEKMPDCVSAREFTICLEEKYADEVEQASDFKLRHADKFMTATNDDSRRADSNNHIENCLETFVLFVKKLK